ncbi:MAG: RNA polymerase sigma factor [Flavobacteriales bacterium]|jgi:RNA polymerase sigma factor (sigma-70 family)
MTDHELVKKCLEGNREAQHALFRQFAGKMLTICARYTESREEAEDVLQEGFIKVFEKMNQWQGTGPLGGWIRTVMVNTALTYIRSRKKWKDHTDLEVAEDLDAGDVDALSQMRTEEILDLIARMPSGYRTVFNLFAIEGYGHKEIADELGISENTSKTQFLKAKAWLKKAMEKTEKIIEHSR